MNLDQAFAALQGRGFDYLGSERGYLMLNAAKDEFEDQWAWPWLQVFTTAPSPLLLADLKLVQMVRCGSRELLGLTLGQALQSDVDLAQQGTPEYWWVEGADTLHLWPGDGADVTIVYVRDSPELVLGTDVPLIPARYHPMWIDYAVIEAYKDSDNFAGAQALRADVYGRMQNVIARYETRNRQHSPFITVRDFHEDE